MPLVETFPADLAEIADLRTDTADQIEASFETRLLISLDRALLTMLAALLAAFATDRAFEAALLTTFTALILLLVSLERAFETMLAALLAAFATERAFEAAVETMLAAFDAAFATDRAFDAAFETVLMCVSRAALAAARTLISFETVLLNTEWAWLRTECA
jgi:hypothetical protein